MVMSSRYWYPVQTLNHKLLLECIKCGRGDLLQHREHSLQFTDTKNFTVTPTVPQSEDDIFLNESLAAAFSRRDWLGETEVGPARKDLRERGRLLAVMMKWRLTATPDRKQLLEYFYLRNFGQERSQAASSPLVLVKKVKSLLASLQPNLFLAWTRHSYSDSGRRPDTR